MREVNHYHVKQTLGKKFFLVLIMLIISGCGHEKDRIADAFRSFNGKYVIYINKNEFTLSVYNRKIEPVEKFTIGYGENPDRKPKCYSGDNRTPEGTYRVNEILSMDFDRSFPPYRKLMNMNRHYFRAKNGHARYGHPDVDLGDNVFGPRYFGLDYPSREDYERYREALNNGTVPKTGNDVPDIGSGIAIHGNADPPSIGHLSSNGCIRMFNSDIVRLDRYIQLGTPVIISPR